MLKRRFTLTKLLFFLLKPLFSCSTLFVLKKLSVLSASEADAVEQFSEIHRNHLAEGRNSQTTPKPLEEVQFGPNRGSCPLPREA